MMYESSIKCEPVSVNLWGPSLGIIVTSHNIVFFVFLNVGLLNLNFHHELPCHNVDLILLITNQEPVIMPVSYSLQEAYDYLTEVVSY